MWRLTESVKCGGPLSLSVWKELIRRYFWRLLFPERNLLLLLWSDLTVIINSTPTYPFFIFVVGSSQYNKDYTFRNVCTGETGPHDSYMWVVPNSISWWCGLIYTLHRRGKTRLPFFVECVYSSNAFPFTFTYPSSSRNPYPPVRPPTLLCRFIDFPFSSVDLLQKSQSCAFPTADHVPLPMQSPTLLSPSLLPSLRD